MKTGMGSLAALSCLALSGGVSTALADSAAASCEVRNHGETKQGPSGPCTFSQRQGNINLDLKNGASYSLTPAGQEGVYRDQSGNKVVRTLTGGSSEEFKWDGGRRIILSFTGGSGGGGYAAAASSGAAERSDPFDTICGVFVGSEQYRYRCGATDFYSGGQKVRTELRFPDQTIQLTWKPGNRVGLQFEGMVPKEARYATSEGETNWVFEGKTYYYYSDKSLAQMEWQHFRD